MIGNATEQCVCVCVSCDRQTRENSQKVISMRKLVPRINPSVNLLNSNFAACLIGRVGSASRSSISLYVSCPNSNVIMF